MMEPKPRRSIPATALRIHLGEALRALEREDIVVEKGGVPVAILSRFAGGSVASARGSDAAYERALSKRAEAGGREQMIAAMDSGWTDAYWDGLARKIRRGRAEGSKKIHFSIDEAEERASVSPGQRRGHRGAPGKKRVADRPAR